MMESIAAKSLFKSILNNPAPPMNRELQVIDLIYPITMEEISVPVRNKGCNENRVCIWPLQSLIKEVQEDAKKGSLLINPTQDLSAYVFTCRMCAEETKLANRFYRDFYYDSKLDYLIRAAKNKYMESFREELSQQSSLKARQKAISRIDKNFKHSKLYIYKGSAILEYKRKIEDGVKVTYRVTVFQETLLPHSEQLQFNPKDYSRNLSALKLAQNMAYKKVGDCIDKGFQEISSTYSKQYQQELEGVLNGCIQRSIMSHTRTVKKEEVYAARISTRQAFVNRKSIELVLFYPRYNLTQIYTFDDREDIINSCNKSSLQICRLPNHQILLYASDYTYIVPLSKAISNFQKVEIPFKRPITVANEKGAERSQAETNISYLRQWDSYHRCGQTYSKLNSVKFIQSPLILANPANEEQIFLLGGTVQGISSSSVYRLGRKDSSAWLKWQQQKEVLACNYKHLQSIIQLNRIFVLAYQELKIEKDSIYKLFLIELEVIQAQLCLKSNKDLNKETKSSCFLPLRAGDNQYLLVDLTSKWSSYHLHLESQQITQYTPKPDLAKFIKQLYDVRNQRTIADSYPLASITHNQITYNIISHSITRHNFKLLYGCSEDWIVSDLPNSLLRD